MTVSNGADHGAKSTSRRRLRHGGIVIVSILALVSVVLGVRVYQVHDQTRDWRLTPAAAPTLLKFGGRDYLRGGTMTSQQLALQGPITADGQTAGGGKIFIPAPAVGGPFPPTSLLVSTDGSEYGYSMMGGP